MALRIGDLTAATSFVGTDLFELSLAGSAGSRKVTGANLRTQLLAGGTGFTSTDPINAGIGTFVGGTRTTSAPVLNVTQTWNDGAVTFTGILANFTNTASAAASLLIDLQVGGISQFKVTRGGAPTFLGAITYGGVTLSNAVTGTGNMVLSASPTFTGTITAAAISATNATINAGSANANIIIGNTSDVGAWGTAQFRSGTSHYSWLIGAQNNVDEGFEITPSTASGGTTFTTPVFKVTQAGVATITGGLTVSAGTTAVQALTATSGIIDQGAGDGEILTLRSSDVAHGMTGNTATSTYGSFQKASAAGGGLDIFGWTESSEGVRIFGSGNAEDSTRSTAAVGSISLIGRTISGSSAAGMNANANILVVGNNGTTKYIWDTDGSAFADVEWTTF